MRKILIFLFVVMSSLRVSAQIRGNNVVVTVEPNHQDWHYKTGEKAQFVVERGHWSMMSASTMLQVLRCIRVSGRA